MSRGIVQIEIVRPGRPVGVYRPDPEDERLHLQEIHMPDRRVSVDHAIVLRTLTVENTPLPVLLLGTASHPPGTRLFARIIGGIHNGMEGRPPVLVAVADADPTCASLSDIPDLDAEQRQQVMAGLQVFAAVDVHAWLERDQVWPQIQEAQRAYRLALNARATDEASPLWRPPAPYRGRLAFARVEHYTEAEYTFFQLPRRFQGYVASHLAPDERILIALWRPRLRSHLQGTFWRRPIIYEGVLILTDQRLLHLTELVPPDSAGVRYGFTSHMGVLERLNDVRVDELSGDVLLLRTRWRTARGDEEVVWEFPAAQHAALEELLVHLRSFLPGAGNGYILRRAHVPPPLDPLPPLVDPATNDPAQVTALQDRFSQWLEDHLSEPVQTWALLPAWAHPSAVAHLLLVTPSTLWQIPDPQAASVSSPRKWALKDVGTLVFQDSILNAYLEVRLPHTRGKGVRFSFPHGAIRAFYSLAERTRRCMIAQAV